MRTERRPRRWLVALGLTALVAAAMVNYAPLGGRATGARLERMKKSPEWQGSHFENPQPIVNDNWAAVKALFNRDPNVDPRSPPRHDPVEPGRFTTRRAQGFE